MYGKLQLHLEDEEVSNLFSVVKGRSQTQADSVSDHLSLSHWQVVQAICSKTNFNQGWLAQIKRVQPGSQQEGRISVVQGPLRCRLFPPDI